MVANVANRSDRTAVPRGGIWVRWSHPRRAAAPATSPTVRTRESNVSNASLDTLTPLEGLTNARPVTGRSSSSSRMPNGHIHLGEDALGRKHRAQEFQTVRTADQVIGRPLGMRHQAHDVSLTIGHRRDVRDGAVLVRRIADLSVWLAIPRHHLTVRLKFREPIR